MQDAVPTTLFTPPVVDVISTSPLGVPPIVLIVGGVILISLYFVFIHRQRRRLDPRELAFRTITRKLGLTRPQITTIRKHAMGVGLASPIGIVMSPELTARVLQD